MAHMMTRMTRMTRWLDSHDSLARWLAACQDPKRTKATKKKHKKPSQEQRHNKNVHVIISFEI